MNTHPYCPECWHTESDWNRLAQHMMKKHGLETNRPCWVNGPNWIVCYCGERFQGLWPFVRHLKELSEAGELRYHHVIGALKKL